MSRCNTATVEVTVPHPQGCPGQYLRISGLTAAICYGCARYGLQGPQLKPQAAMQPGGTVWQCPDRVTEFPAA